MMMVKSIWELKMVMKVTSVHSYYIVNYKFPFFSAKRRLKEAGDDGDAKMAKKARKLAEIGSGSQQNSMLNFVRTGQSATHAVSALKKQSTPK
jgi:hypothetical protein